MSVYNQNIRPDFESVSVEHMHTFHYMIIYIYEAQTLGANIGGAKRRVVVKPRVLI